jgi:hypothetical protein
MNMPLILSTLLALGGMLALFLGLERHFKQLLTQTPPRRLLHGLRASGWLALVASLFTSAMTWGWAMGAIGWFGLVSLAGVTMAFAAPYLSRSRVFIDSVPPRPSRQADRRRPGGHSL